MTFSAFTRVLPTALLAAFWSSSSLAVVPTEAEWAAWPDYCRVRFVVAGDGRDSEFVARVPQSDIESWRARMGPAWYALHHHCYGLVFLERSRFEKTAADRMYRLQSAIREQTFALNRTPPEHPMYATMASQIGLAHQLRKEYAQAESAFDQAISAQPSLAIGYQGKALLYREMNRRNDALEVLKKADQISEGKSAEIQYFLGLILFDMKRYDESRERARQAYSLGYPLPGLANKLARAGFPLD